MVADFHAAPCHGNLQGRRSRSLVAIYKLMASNQFSDIMHVGGGVREWCVLTLAQWRWVSAPKSRPPDVMPIW